MGYFSLTFLYILISGHKIYSTRDVIVSFKKNNLAESLGKWDSKELSTWIARLNILI